VHVASVAGELVAQLRLPETTSITTLKNLVETASGVPVTEQRLLLGVDLIGESCRLGDLAVNDKGELWISLVRVRRRWAISGDALGSMQVWDLEDETRVQVLAGPVSVRCVAVDWAARVAISGLTSGAMKVWDLGRGACLRELQGEGVVRSVAIDWHSRLALSASSDGALRLWDLSGTRCIKKLCRHEKSVTSVAVDWSAARAVSGAEDGLMCLWDLDSGECLWHVQSHTAVYHVDLDWATRTALGTGTGGSHALRVYDLELQACTRTFVDQKPSLPIAASDLAARVAVSGMSGGNSLDLWDLQGGALLRRLRVGAPVHSLALNWTVRLVLVGGGDGVLRLFDLENGACLCELEGHDDAVACLAMS